MKYETLPKIKHANYNYNNIYFKKINIYSDFCSNNKLKGISKNNLSNTNYDLINGIVISNINKNDIKSNTNKLKNTIIPRNDESMINYYDKYFSDKKKQKKILKNSLIKENKNNLIDNISNYKKQNNGENTNFKYNLLNKKSINNVLENNKKKCPLCDKEINPNRLNFHINLHPSQIFPWLYLGSYRNACDKEDLKDLNITYILNCATECYDYYPNDFHYCHLQINDLPSFNLIPYLNKAINFIEEAHKNNCNILVHCQLGISRSTSCVIAYMIKVLKYNALTALQFIKGKRKQVMPNFGFLEQLIQFEKNNLNNTDDNI